MNLSNRKIDERNFGREYSKSFHSKFEFLQTRNTDLKMFEKCQLMRFADCLYDRECFVCKVALSVVLGMDSVFCNE